MKTSRKIKITALVCVGPLNRLSYQYNAKIVLENFAEFFDRVYVVSSSRETRSLPVVSSKIALISDAETWFPVDDHGAEIYNAVTLNRGLNKILNIAIKEGTDFAICMCVNQYIDSENSKRMRDYCGRLHAEGRPFGYLYKAYQILDKITYPDVRLPWVVNARLCKDNQISFAADSIFFQGKNVRIENGLYLCAPFYITDVYGEMTEQDFVERWNYYLKHLRKSVRGEEGDSGWDYWRRYYEKKANRKVVNKHATLSDWGRKILANIPPNALVYKIKINRFDRLQLLRQKLINIVSGGDRCH